ncbi:MAG: plastocyanin/azurin family copper-binding protein [Thermomicrobiales bacterium]|nr:plastocyanin/azurin family copper-binding protein [Thermomicrobiales bacterium]
MKFLNRRRFVAAGSVTAVSAVLVACGNEPLTEEELNPTQIPDVPGAPPTLAPITDAPGGETEGSGSGETGSGEAPEALVIETHDTFSFSPNEVDVSPGQVIKVHNTGFLPHDLVVDAWGIGTAQLNTDEEEELTIPADAEIGAKVEFHCSVPGHKESGMTGTFTIVEAGAAAPTETEDDAAEAPAGDGGTAEAITIETHDNFSFEPSDVEVVPGQVIKVHNTGFLPHDLVVDDWGIGTAQLNTDEAEEITIPADAAVGSTVEFHCSVPGHKESGMTGTFTVVEAGAAAPPADESTEEATEDEATAEAPAGETPAAGSGEPITIEALDSFAFDPKEVDVMPGQTIHVINTGFLPHDLVVEDWGVGTEELQMGGEGEFTIPADAAVGSTIEFHCSVPGHKESGMKGTFTVVGGAAETEEAAEAEATAEAPAGETPAAVGSSEPIVIEALDSFAFDPKEVDVVPGQTIKLINTGFLPHDLVVEDWGVGTEELGIGGEGEFTIPADAEVGSTVEFHCSVPGHKESGMKGTFTVVADSADAPAEDEDAGEAPVGDGGSAEPIVIEALDSFAFDPKEVDVIPRQTIKLINTGFLPHDLVVDDWGVGTEELGIGGEGEFTIPADAEVGSTVDFHCSVPGHKESGMVGKFTVVAGGSNEGTGEGSPVAAGTPVPASVHAVTVVGTKWQFEPAEFEIAPGGIITFQNNTGMLMGLSSEEWDKNALQPMIKSIADGDSAEFTVPDDAEVGAEIEFKSNLSEAEKQGMVGKITIVAGDGGTPVATRRSRRSLLASVFAAR